MRTIVVAIALVMWTGVAAQAEDLGNLSANPFLYESTANPLGKGSPLAPNGINNPLSPYGSPFSNQSATNPFATEAPRRSAGELPRQAECEHRWFLWFMSPLSLFGSFGFPIRQPNERDKLNRPDKQNEPLSALPTARGARIDPIRRTIRMGRAGGLKGSSGGKRTRALLRNAIAEIDNVLLLPPYPPDRPDRPNRPDRQCPVPPARPARSTR